MAPVNTTMTSAVPTVRTVHTGAPTSPAAPPVTAPTVPATRPDVWSMPDAGAEWCDCGQHHPVDHDLVHTMILRRLGKAPERTRHTEICRVLMDMWCYVEVCEGGFDEEGPAGQSGTGR